MFRVTSLGHQGWLIGSARTHLLVDPILTPRFTRMPCSDATIHPPREIALERFPAIDAVVITHEHPDHLDFASLRRLDPRTPVFLSAHSSDAARRALGALGLEVCAAKPGVAATIGDLSLLPFAPLRVGENGSNEIDVTPLLFRDRDGHGSFFTSVDLPASAEWTAEVRRHVDRPGVWADANSSFDRSMHFEWCRRVPDPLSEVSRMFAERYLSAFAAWGHPEVVLVTDNGLTLGADLRPMNAHVFEVDNDSLASAVETMLPGHVFRAAWPGTTVELVDGELAAIRTSQPFLAPRPRAEWPTRGGAPYELATRTEFAPGTGRRTLGPDEHARLEALLGEFARFLFGRATFRGLYRLVAERDYEPSRIPTVALALREGEPRQLTVWEFRPTDGTFTKVACADPTSRYVAGIEVWASDLLAVLTLQASVEDLFHFGRKWVWNAAHAVFRCDLDTEIELFVHPLRNPRAGEALYRACLGEPVVPSLRGPETHPHVDWPPPPSRSPRFRPVPVSLARLAQARASTAGNPSGSSGNRAPTEAEQARWTAMAEAVARATESRWTLVGVEPRGVTGFRLTLAVPGGASLQIQITPRAETPRHYKALGDVAFSYTGSAVDAATLTVLDAVIAAVGAALGPPPRA